MYAICRMNNKLLRETVVCNLGQRISNTIICLIFSMNIEFVILRMGDINESCYFSGRVWD